MDRERAISAVHDLLKALDQEVESEGLKDTPRRVADMFIEQCTSRDEPELDRMFEEKFDEMVIVRDIPFVGCCEHHLVFYFGRAHIAYLPRKRVLGISKLARLVYYCSKGFTIQERVTKEVADKLYEEVDPLGCMVIIEAAHGCMNLRGAKTMGSSTITSCVRGVFRDVPAARSEFMSLIAKGGIR